MHWGHEPEKDLRSPNLRFQRMRMRKRKRKRKIRKGPDKGL
jgi:hypothetical protein